MSDTIDFTFIDGWVLKADADEDNKVFHVTISNNNGDITTLSKHPGKELTFSFALVQEAKDEEV